MEPETFWAVERGSAAFFVFWECETVPLYGANELLFRRFGGGLVRDQDPTEIGDDQASDALNVDFEDETLTKRLGRTAFNASAPVASRVRGVYRYYGRDGEDGKFLVQAGTSIYESDGGALVGGEGEGAGDDGPDEGPALVGGEPMDFVGWKERVYAGNGKDSVRRRTSDGVWSEVTLIAAPAAPELAPAQEVLEAFDSGLWARSGSALSTGSDPADYNAVRKREGVKCFRLQASGSGAVGSYVFKSWSSGRVVDTTLDGAINGSTLTVRVASVAGIAVGDYLQIESEFVKVTAINVGTRDLTVDRGQLESSAASHGNGATVVLSRLDLSKVQFVSLWVYSERIGVSYQVGVTDNHGLLDFSLFPNFTAYEKDTWVRIRVPLDKIPPTDRTASTALGIRFGEKPAGVNLGTNPVNLFFDEARPEGPLVPDHYFYTTTYAETDTNHDVEVVVRESNPSPVAELDVPVNDALLGVRVTVDYSTDDTVKQVLVYRRRREGPFARARLVKTLENDAGGGSITFTDLLGEDEVALSDAPELVGSKIAPPIAKTYAVANSRLVAGHAYVDSDGNDAADKWYPWRLYLSRLGYPEEFGGDREPTDPSAPGWLDIANRDHIRRLVEFDGQLLVFCDRAIYTLEGSGWDDFAFRKRADVGLDAREAVAKYDRFIFFLAGDGVRVLAPNRSFDGLFETWVVSEPVDSVLRRIPREYREDVAFGLDERGRLHVSYTPAGGTVNSEALVFDPTQGGGGRGAALAPGYQSARPGWTQYSNWGFSCFCTLKRGGGDAGQLVGGDPATATLHYLQRDDEDAALAADAGAAIAWHWQGKAQDAGPGSLFEWVFVGAELDANAGPATTVNDAGGISASDTSVTVTSAAGLAVDDYVQIEAEVLRITGLVSATLTVARGQAGTAAAAHADGATVTRVQVVTATPILEGAPSATPYPLSLGTAASGFVSARRRCGAAVRGRFSALRLSGSHGVPVKCRSARIGAYVR